MVSSRLLAAANVCALPDTDLTPLRSERHGLAVPDKSEWADGIDVSSRGACGQAEGSGTKHSRERNLPVADSHPLHLYASILSNHVTLWPSG